ncbi:hypothetical protein IW261DRAFT_941004 [Armillaria novae-zelandiae]|uniref:F-box domain-containing protein n=1 Tax=Armillaria novae-zelandiae TaxID=153914 RepID=A0AA39PFV5_9AGAR|nr:hypothetical protein IW261DRAFT_941004 [Armillaria novae-zelandiae]
MRNNMDSPTILQLPVELQQRILSKLPSRSRLRFVSACKVLSSSFGFSAVHDALNEAKGCTHRNDLKITYPQLLCLAPSRTLVWKRVKHVTYPEDPDDLGKGDKGDFHDDDSDYVVAPSGSRTMKQRVSKTWVVEPVDLKHALTEPFYICSAKFTETRDDILLYVTFPEYNLGSYEENDIHVSSHGVEPCSEYMDKYIATLQEHITDGDGFHVSGPHSYNKMLETGAVLGAVDHTMLREFFLGDCTQCRGARTICPGCGVLTRWPEAFASCGFDTPCPQCIGYDAAMTAVGYTRHKSQRLMDEELNIATVKHTFLSHEQWEARRKTKKKPTKKKDSDNEAYVNG